MRTAVDICAFALVLLSFLGLSRLRIRSQIIICAGSVLAIACFMARC